MRIGLAVSACVLLAACASAPEWRHSHLSGADADAAFLVADGQCALEASGVQAPAPMATQTGHAVKGQATTTAGTSTSTTQFSAEVTPTQVPNYAQAYQQGRAAGAAQHDRRRVYRGCMARHGWMQDAE